MSSDRARWVVVAVALTIVAVACIGTVLRSPGGAGAAHPAVTALTTPAPAPAISPRVTTIAPRPTPRPTPRATPRSSAPVTATQPVSPPRAPPVHLTIARIGVSEPLLRLGLRPDRTVEVPAPSDAAYPGWFRLGPPPGQIGSSVILGHVDSLKGPAVFYELRLLQPGNHVDVRLQGGAVAHFTVRDVVTYPNDRFPAQEVYGPHGYRALNLVTCGGAYDRARGGYQSNVVAYTRLVATTPPPAG